MFVSEISLWGAAIVACIVLVAMMALAFFDRQMLRRMLVIFGATVAQMAVVVAVVWVVYQTYAWWAYLLWFLLVLALSICWCLYPLQALWRKMLQPVSAAMFVGSIVVGGSTMLMLPISVFLSIYSVLMACMTASLMQTMMRYQRNQQKPEMLREDGTAPGDGRANALCRHVAGRSPRTSGAARHPVARSRLLRRQHISRRDSAGDDQEEQGHGERIVQLEECSLINNPPAEMTTGGLVCLEIDNPGLRQSLYKGLQLSEIRFSPVMSAGCSSPMIWRREGATSARRPSFTVAELLLVT